MIYERQAKGSPPLCMGVAHRPTGPFGEAGARAFSQGDGSTGKNNTTMPGTLALYYAILPGAHELAVTGPFTMASPQKNGVALL